MGPIHIYPINDLKEHKLDEFCECDPVFEDGVWIHSSFSGREYIEKLIDDNNINLN